MPLIMNNAAHANLSVEKLWRLSILKLLPSAFKFLEMVASTFECQSWSKLRPVACQFENLKSLKQIWNLSVAVLYGISARSSLSISAR